MDFFDALQQHVEYDALHAYIWVNFPIKLVLL